MLSWELILSCLSFHLVVHGCLSLDPWFLHELYWLKINAQKVWCSCGSDDNFSGLSMNFFQVNAQPLRDMPIRCDVLEESYLLSRTCLCLSCGFTVLGWTSFLFSSLQCCKVLSSFLLEISSLIWELLFLSLSLFVYQMVMNLLPVIKH